MKRFIMTAAAALTLTACAQPAINANGTLSPAGQSMIGNAPGVAALNCGTYTNELRYASLSNAAGRIKANPDAFHGKRLLPGGVSSCVIRSGYVDSVAPYTVNLIEKATVNGVPVTVDHGYASFHAGAWVGDCQTDKMDDSRHCSLSRDGGNLTVTRWGDGHTFLSVIGDHYPGSPSEIRVNGKLYSGDHKEGIFTPPLSTGIYSELNSNAKVITRYTNWPYNAYQTKEIDMTGFTQAKALFETVTAAYFEGGK
ncbi:hypothetical protein MRQ47_004442 [Salmonella enterica]|nr:hypothetical protein [Salmonella enterica]